MMSELELEKSVKRYLTKGRLIAAGVLFVLLLVSYGLGSTFAKIDLADEKVTYDELQEKISDARAEEKEAVQDIRTNISAEEEKLKDKQSEVKEALAAVANKDRVEEETKKLQGTIDTKKAQISELDGKIAEKTNELKSLEGKVFEAKGAPIQLPAGMLSVGKDIQPGRYKVVPVGRGSNFFVYDSSGSNLVNIIISSVTDHGVPEYVTYLNEGYIIEANAPFKYIPVN